MMIQYPKFTMSKKKKKKKKKRKKAYGMFIVLLNFKK